MNGTAFDGQEVGMKLVRLSGGSHLRLSALCLACLLAPGCALFNGYPTAPDRTWRTANPSLSEAIAYSGSAKSKLRSMLSQNAEFKSGLGVGLIPLGAAALGVGITGGSPVAITVLGLTGATGYGIGAWLENGPRERAYVLGYNAIQCAEDLTVPLIMDPGVRSEAERALADVDSAIGDVTIAAAKVRRARPGASPELQSEADSQLEVADSSVAAAVSARSNTVALLQDVAQAGPALVSAVDRILGQVNELVQSNQHDLSAVLTIIGGLGNVYGSFTAVPESLKPKPPAAAAAPAAGPGAQAAVTYDDASMIAALDELARALAHLDTDTRAMRDFVNAAVKAKPTTTLASCGVPAGALVGELSTQPAGDLQFTSKKAETHTIHVLGGERPYGATLSGSDGVALSVSQPVVFGPDFAVKYTGAEVSGGPVLVIADGTGRSIAVPISIAQAASDAPPPGAPPAGGAVFEGLSVPERKQIQRALCVSDDGTWGPKSAAGLEGYRKAKESHETGVLTAPEKDALLKETAAEIAARCMDPDKPPAAVAFASQVKGKTVSIGGVTFTVDREPTISGDPGNVSLHLSAEPSGPVTADAHDLQKVTEAFAALSAPPFPVDRLSIENWNDVKGAQ